MEKICPHCQKIFKVSPSTFHRRIYCSFECYWEHKNKNPKKYNLFQKGHKGYKTFPWLGKKLSKTHKQNIGNSLKQSKKFKQSMKEYGKKHSKENHWNWKGGITEELRLLRQTDEYKMWRNQVYARDNWTCQKCGNKLKNLTAHHKKSFKDNPELRYNLDNGVTLCRSCHKKLHEEIGKQTRFKIK